MNNEINELLKATQELEQKVESLFQHSQRAIDQLPPEEKAKLSFFERDVEAMKQALRDRDMSKIQTFLTKYAGNSSEY